MLTPGPAGTNKAMLVFSDGQQNTGDQISEAGVNAYLETNSHKNISNGGQIKIHTVGLGLSGSIPLTMSSIASHNGGQYLNASTTATDFATFFATNLTNIFAGRSPQIVSIKKSAFPASTGLPSASEQSFSINKGSNAIIVTMFAPTTSEAHFVSFSKGATDLIQFATQSSGPGFRTITLKFPIASLPGVTADGDWKVKAQLGGSAPAAVGYTMVILTDDHIVEPGYSVGSASFKEGDVLNPRVTLFQINKPIANATIQALVVRPGDNVDNLLANTTVDFKMPAGDSSSPDVAKLAILMQDSNFVKKIMGQNQIVNLTYNAGDSSYKGAFNGLNVTGVYKVIYLVTADDPELGKIQRYHEQGFYVRFPEIDISKSNAVLATDPAGKSILTIRFATSKGIFIGSGFRSVIHLDATGGVQIQSIDDLGDGTYRIHFTDKLSGNGKLSLANETVYEGDLAKIRKSWW
jgi:hypothetical protein